MGILMRGIKRDDVRRGMMVAKPGTLKQHDRFTAQIYMMTKEEGGREKPLVSNMQGGHFWRLLALGQSSKKMSVCLAVQIIC